MKEADRYDVLVLGSGTGGKLVAWTMAKEGRRTAVVERKLIGGSCPNVACLPSKNIIHTAKVASLFGRHREFGIQTGPIAVNMAGVYARKRKMVDEIVQVHLDRYHASGDELILGDGKFVAPHHSRHIARRRRTDTYRRPRIRERRNPCGDTGHTWAAGCKANDACRGPRFAASS